MEGNLSFFNLFRIQTLALSPALLCVQPADKLARGSATIYIVNSREAQKHGPPRCLEETL